MQYWPVVLAAVLGFFGFKKLGSNRILGAVLMAIALCLLLYYSKSGGAGGGLGSLTSWLPSSIQGLLPGGGGGNTNWSGGSGSSWGGGTYGGGSSVGGGVLGFLKTYWWAVLALIITGFLMMRGTVQGKGAAITAALLLGLGYYFFGSGGGLGSLTSWLPSGISSWLPGGGGGGGYSGQTWGKPTGGGGGSSWGLGSIIQFLKTYWLVALGILGLLIFMMMRGSGGGQGGGGLMSLKGLIGIGLVLALGYFLLMGGGLAKLKGLLPGGGGGGSSGGGQQGGCSCRVTHVVQPGDTLFRIALNNGSTMQAICDCSGLANPNYIVVGQQLCIP